MSHATQTHASTHGASAAHGAHGAGHDHGTVGHLVPASVLYGTALALLVLTVITVAVRYIDVGEFNIHIAIGIAVIKASLVAAFFMHLRWDRPFNLLVFITCVLGVVLFMAFAVMDTKQYEHLIFRGNPPAVQQTLESAAPGAPVARYTQYAP